ncbi:hypothetical protein [Helcococcus bovis]|uniref:hypothetical protein n=1 Tax=Helcococcus bovis TaxID=3153252 RepID=UPI0038BCB271
MVTKKDFLILERNKKNLLKKKEEFNKAKSQVNNAKNTIIENEKNILYSIYLKSKLDFNDFYNILKELVEEKVDTNKNI